MNEEASENHELSRGLLFETPKEKMQLLTFNHIQLLIFQSFAHTWAILNRVKKWDCRQGKPPHPPTSMNMSSMTLS